MSIINRNKDERNFIFVVFLTLHLLTAINRHRDCLFFNLTTLYYLSAPIEVTVGFNRFLRNCLRVTCKPSRSRIRLEFHQLVSLFTFYMSDRETSVTVSKENTQPALNFELSSLTINRLETMEEVLNFYL